MKRVKQIMSGQVIFIILCLVIAAVFQGRKMDESNQYSAPIEVRYIAEKIIKNSEGRIYEYEYELRTEENNSLFLHSKSKQKLSNKIKVAYVRENINGKYKRLNKIVNYEQVENFQKELDFGKWFVLKLAVGMLLILFFTICYYYFIRHRKKKVLNKILERDKLYKNIEKVERFICYNYSEFKQIADSLVKISEMIDALDHFYRGREDEENYIHGLRQEIKSIIDYYLENMEIDRQFVSQKVIKKELHRELQSTLEQFLMHVQAQISTLTKANDSKIYKELDKIKAESELSGDAIEYLSKKYSEEQ